MCGLHLRCSSFLPACPSFVVVLIELNRHLAGGVTLFLVSFVLFGFGSGPLWYYTLYFCCLMRETE
jgi:hypothetical protein